MDKPPDPPDPPVPPSPAAFIECGEFKLVKKRRKHNSCKHGVHKHSKISKAVSLVSLNPTSVSHPADDSMSASSASSVIDLGQQSLQLNKTLTPQISNDILIDSLIEPTSSLPHTFQDPLASCGPRSVYSGADTGPYVVHVKRIDELTVGTTLHPVSFGRLLKNLNTKNIINGSIKSVGRNRVSLTFDSFKSANNFLLDQVLKEHNFAAFIPAFSITKIGIIRGVPVEWTPEEVIDLFEVPQGFGPIIKARRLSYKTRENGIIDFKKSQSVVLTFDGQRLPPRVFACYNAFSVDAYIYPTIQCFACCRFGHTKVMCRSKPRCFKCGREHTGDTCSVAIENAVCLSCSGGHFATSKSCAEYIRQNNIKKTMSDNSISYIEATKLHPVAQKSYADALSSVQKTYKKTIFKTPRSPPPSTSGYDKVAHAAMIQGEKSSFGNGAAISHPAVLASSEEQIISMLLSIISCISTSFHHLPPNVASALSSITSLLAHGSKTQDHAVELSKP